MKTQKTITLTLIMLALLLTSACTEVITPPTENPVIESPTAGSPVEPPTATPVPSTATAEPTATTVPTLAPVAYGPQEFPANISQISGKAASDPSLLERRPVAVKVQLFPRGQRPPWGVSLADIVYDYYQNFGLTRLHAIYLGQNAETVGPIRSARLLDQSLVNMYASVFAFGSAEQRTYSRLFGSEAAGRLVVEGNANCPPMCRIDPNGANLLVTNTDELSQYATSQGVDNVRQPLGGMYFNDLIPSSGQPGSQISTRFSISSYLLWDFNPETGRYLRYQDTQEANDSQTENLAPLTDQLTQQQISADNVVVLLVPHQYAFGTKPGPNEVVDILLSGSGPGFAFREGQAFPVTWNRPNKDSVLFLTLPDGSPYAYKPGSTWYEVIGQSSKQESPSAGVWRFIHYIP